MDSQGLLQLLFLYSSWELPWERFANAGLTLSLAELNTRSTDPPPSEKSTCQEGTDEAVANAPVRLSPS